MIKFVAALIGIGILGTSLLGNYFLLNKYDAERDKVKVLEITAATLKVTMDYERKQQQENDEKIASFKIEIDNIASQRDSYRRKMQEALKKDENLNAWASSRLPDYVRESFKRVRDEGSSASPDSR